jgi:hypothetical protein
MRAMPVKLNPYRAYVQGGKYDLLAFKSRLTQYAACRLNRTGRRLTLVSHADLQAATMLATDVASTLSRRSLVQ